MNFGAMQHSSNHNIKEKNLELLRYYIILLCIIVLFLTYECNLQGKIKLNQIAYII